ncbi:MAG TPA: hypothetical protein PLI45_00260 [Candidatus Woesebacteria bacterium]|nr:hypothetical protein [Candidatus Woesebacteria bacterium]
MKKFAVLMVFVMILSVILTGCAPSQESGQICDLIISPDKLEDYDGQKATYLGSYEGLVTLNVDGRHICVTENGLYSSDIGESVNLLVRTKYFQNEIGEQYFSGMGYSYLNMYSGMTGTIRYVGSPVFVLDEVMQMVYKESCTLLDQDSIGQLNGREVKITGVWTPDPYSGEYLVLESNGQNYCYTHNIDIYKTTDVFGEPHHIPFYTSFGVIGSSDLLLGVVGKITTELDNDGDLLVYFDAGEGQREEDIDPMIEEISSRSKYLSYLQYEGWYEETITDGMGNVYSLMSNSEAPILKPGYLISPKSYTYGGPIDIGVVIGEIDGKPLTMSLVEDCYQDDDGSFSAKFSFSYDGDEVVSEWGSTEYISLIKGNGADQEIVYYKFDASAFCPK